MLHTCTSTALYTAFEAKLFRLHHKIRPIRLYHPHTRTHTLTYIAFSLKQKIQQNEPCKTRKSINLTMVHICNFYYSGMHTQHSTALHIVHPFRCTRLYSSAGTFQLLSQSSDYLPKNTHSNFLSLTSMNASLIHE